MFASTYGKILWFTGLPCSGKTTLARVLVDKIKIWTPNICHLDGDTLRNTPISKDLGFSPEDRRTNLLRAATTAKLLSVHGTNVVASFITPTNDIRREIRGLLQGLPFTLVYVATPPEICEERDVKGMWAKARKGEIENFTGVDAPFERPESHNGNIWVYTDQNVLTCASNILHLIEASEGVSSRASCSGEGRCNCGHGNRV